MEFVYGCQATLALCRNSGALVQPTVNAVQLEKKLMEETEESS